MLRDQHSYGSSIRIIGPAVKITIISTIAYSAKLSPTSKEQEDIMEFNEPRNLYGQFLQIKKRYYHQILGMLDDALIEFEKEYEEARGKYGDEYLEDLADEGGLLQSDIQDTAEVFLVSIYHWVETKLKNLLHHSHDPKDYQAKEQINKSGIGGIKKRFKKLGTDLDQINSFRLVDILRRFTNSWKHEPNRPSQELLDGLEISNSLDLRGLLSSGLIRDKLNDKFGVDGSDETSFQLVERALDVGVEFLQEVCNQSDFIPNYLKK